MARINGTRLNDRLDGTPQQDVITARAGNDQVFGLQGNDIIAGGRGNDVLYGDSDNDVLYGIQGRDTLTGGSGRDKFAIGGQTDTIVDFVDGEDLIVLPGSLTFNELQIVGGTGGDAGDTRIIDRRNDGVLAVLSAVDSSVIDQNDFTGDRTPIPAPTPPDNAGNSLAAARDIGLLSATETVLDFVGNADVEDFYRFSLDTQVEFNLTLEGLSADADVFLIADANGNGEIDDGDILDFSNEGSTTPEAIRDVLPEGTYFVLVEQFSGNTDYTLNLTAGAMANVPPDNAGNSLESARDIGTLTQGVQTFSDFVGAADLSDIYRFSLSESSNLRVRLRNLSADADLFLVQDLNENGEIDLDDVLAESVRANSNPEAININLASGTYFVGVEQFQGETTYDLSLEATPTSTPTPTPTPTGYSQDIGYGLVDAAAAVASAIGEPTFADVPDRFGNRLYGLDLIKAPEVWERGFTGEGIVVAVLDTGVDYTHPDLAGNIWRNLDEMENGIDDDGNGFIDDVRGYDFVAENDNDPKDGDEHGSHVAGTIAAQLNDFGITGVAYNAEIMPVRVIDEDLRVQPFPQYAIDVAEGIRYAAENGADVINMSLGIPRRLQETSQVRDAIRFAVEERGVVVVSAAGNEGGRRPGFPADFAADLGIAVGAIDRNERFADFSNRAGADVLDYVLAPGVEIRSTIPNDRYRSFDGTSMASPHVAGVAALMLSANGDLTPAEVENILIQTANPDGILV